jgi:molybdopterin-synthase adenylyltransferase
VKRPRIKFSHRPVRHDQDCVQIGGIVYGIAVVIPDPDGWVWALVQLLDGSRSVEHVVADLLRLRPERPERDIRLAIDDLIQAGYIEDAEEPDPDGLTDADRERYSRSRALFQWVDRIPHCTSWDTQVRLRRAKVTVVGVGGVGCTAALALTVSGVGHVHCVDRDVVELSDLNRQILYTERDLGHRKVEAAVRRLRKHNSGVLVTGEHCDIDGPEVLIALAARFDVVLLAADQPAEIRSWTNRACHKTGTDWVHGGYHGPLISIGLFRPGTGPCYDCGYVAERARQAALPPRTEWPPAVGVVHPQAATAVTAGMTGYLATHAVMSLITGVPALPVNRQYGINLVTLEDSFVFGPQSPVPQCPTCGTGS